MIDHIKNLKEYLDDDVVYKRYKLIKDDDYFSNYEMFCINHCQDIEWAIDELKALYELVKEMKNENIKTRTTENERKN